MENFEPYLPYLKFLGILAATFLVGVILTRLLFRLLTWYGRKSEDLLPESLDRNLRRPAMFFLPVLICIISFSWMEVPEELAFLATLLEMLLYLFGAWLIVQFTDVVGDMVRERFQSDGDNNLAERKVLTQLQYIKRVTAILVIFLAIAFILLQFDGVRELGAGLLTSAGVAGIIVGFAAQKSIANLLAGFQIAFTQPIRMDDVVIVEGDFGRVEEITLTYVVVRVWDQRRIVLPITYFIEKPFQNWTRQSAELLGTVYLYTDYGLPIAALREKLTEVLENHPLWDRRVNQIVVTDAKADTLELRALVSGRNASEVWDLRCHVREQLITFVQQN